MTEERINQIEKPWAVYNAYLGGSCGIGKVVHQKSEEDSYWIIKRESQLCRSEPWNPNWVKTFGDPIKAIAYFFRHQNFFWEYSYSKAEIIYNFLKDFPSERENIRKRLPKYFYSTLAQSQPKCTNKKILLKNLL